MNLRDLGDVDSNLVPKGVYLRSGKLSVLTKDECAELCNRYHIKSVIDLRTSMETEEFPDPLPEGVEYRQITILEAAAVGVTHEKESDPMIMIRNLRHHPEKLKEMIPDFKVLYLKMVTDDYCRAQLDDAVATLRRNAEKGICTLFHCTAGKDRTGVVSMALLKSYGVRDDAIIKDYMRTNSNAFFPTLKKCLGVALLTRNWYLVKSIYKVFMADRKLIEIAMSHYRK